MVISMAILVAHVKNHQETWMQLNHALYGIGGIFGPMVVYIFKNRAYMVLGIAIAATVPLYFWYTSPEILR